MARARILVGIDSPPAPRTPLAARLRALARGCDLVLCAASPGNRTRGREFAVPAPNAFRISLSHAASTARVSSAVLIDGPATRAALLPGRLDEKMRVALWADARSPSGDDARPSSEATVRTRLPWVDEFWWTGPRGTGDAALFVSGAFKHLEESSIGAHAARFSRAERRPERGMTTIVIPCWNGLADTRLCLDALFKHTTAPFEIVLVDNGSSDGTADYANSLRDRRLRVVRHRENLGFARAVNRGLAEARGPYAVWLNNDCVVTPGWLELLQDALERAPWIGAVGPMTHGARALQRDEGPAPKPRDLARYAAAWSMSHKGRMSWVNRLEGFCLLHRTELLRNVGFLDERFGLGCYEDFDWCLRVRQAGYELHVAEDVYVAHRAHATFYGNQLDRAAILRRNRAAFVDKWCRRGLVFLDELDSALTRSRPTRKVAS